MSKMSANTRRSLWIFTVNKDLKEFQDVVEQEFPFKDYLYYLKYQKERGEEGHEHLQGCMQLCKKDRMSAIKKRLQCKHMHMEAVKQWDDAQAYCSKEDTRIEEPKEYGKYIAHKQKVSNSIIAKKTGASLSELRDMSKQERVELMREKLIETDNIEETLMDMYKEIPCSMYEAEMALKQAKRQKNGNQIQEAKQDAEKVVIASTPLTDTTTAVSTPLAAVPLTVPVPTPVTSGVNSKRKRKAPLIGEPSAKLKAHIKHCQKKKRSENQVGRGRRAALQNHARVETFRPTHTYDILASLKELEPEIIDHLKQQLETPIKWYINMLCIFKKIMIDVDGDTTEDKNNIYQASKTYTCTQPYEIDESIPEVFQTISGNFDEFQSEGSGWILDYVVHIEVHTATYAPLVSA